MSNLDRWRPVVQHSNQARSPATKLAGIEALRGLAATMVVLSHVARHLDRAAPAPDLITLFQPGHAGVDLFFTLSGFIVLFVHQRDIGASHRLLHYAARRFDRVMPLYWLALGVTVALSVASGYAMPSAPWLLWWAALLPTAGEPLFGIAWTLQYEAMFYVGFAVLIVDRRAGTLALAAWLLVIVAGLFSTPLPVCGAFGLEFLFGMAAARVLHSLRIPRPRIVAGSGAVLFATAYVLESRGMMGGYGVAARFAFGLPAALIIVGLVAAEREGALIVPRSLATLGSASYSIYLFQFTFVGAGWQVLHVLGWADRLPAPISFALLTASALAGGVVVARHLEQPLLASVRLYGWFGLFRRLIVRVGLAPGSA